MRNPWSVSSLVRTNSISSPCFTVTFDGLKVNRSATIEITRSGLRSAGCCPKAEAQSRRNRQKFHQNHHPMPRLMPLIARTTVLALRLKT